MFASCHVTHLASIFSVCIKQQHVCGKHKSQCVTCHAQGVTAAEGTDYPKCDTRVVHMHYATSNCFRPCGIRHCEGKKTHAQKSCAHQILYVLHIALAMLTQLTHVNHLLLNGLGYLDWGAGQAPQRPLLLQERWWLLLPCLQSSADCSKDFCGRLCCCYAEMTLISSSSIGNLYLLVTLLR